MKPVLGLIGGIGSGKSQAAAELARHGGRVLSGDAAGHEALLQPEVRDRLVQRWGGRVLNESGEIDRRKVGAFVFADLAELKALEAIVHPWIERRLRKEITTAQADPDIRFLVLDAAIMLEAGWNRICDKVIFVDAPREVRLRRLAEQRGWDAGEVARRERAQMPLAEKRKQADAVLMNDGSPEELARELESLLRRWGLLTCPP
jgi:dephospho-CoA kinase